MKAKKAFFFSFMPPATCDVFAAKSGKRAPGESKKCGMGEGGEWKGSAEGKPTGGRGKSAFLLVFLFPPPSYRLSLCIYLSARFRKAAKSFTIALYKAEKV